MASILNIDKSICDLAQLDYGQYVKAEDVSGDWIARYKDKYFNFSK